MTSSTLLAQATPPQPITQDESPQSEVKTSLWRRALSQIIGGEETGSQGGFIAFPTVAYAPETGWDVGLSSLYVYFAHDDPNNRLSEIKLYVFYTQNQQYGAWLSHSLYSHHSEWLIQGQARLQSFPVQFYGVGPESTQEVKAIIESDSLWLRERIFRRVIGDLYFGLELDLRVNQEVSYQAQSSEGALNPLLGLQGSRQLGIGAGVIYDTRRNALNPRDGISLDLNALTYSQSVSRYPMTSLAFDGRLYHSLAPDHGLAAQVVTNLTWGEAPFDQLPTLGGAMMMRGYYLGRYRGHDAWSTQLEYRYLPLKPKWRLGASIFGAIGGVSTAPLSLSTLNQAVWAVGLGPRILLFPQKDVFTRLDFAFTEEGSGVYIYIGEAF